jgi:hypothetical protein
MKTEVIADEMGRLYTLQIYHGGDGPGKEALMEEEECNWLSENEAEEEQDKRVPVSNFGELYNSVLRRSNLGVSVNGWSIR